MPRLSTKWLLMRLKSRILPGSSQRAAPKYNAPKESFPYQSGRIGEVHQPKPKYSVIPAGKKDGFFRKVTQKLSLKSIVPIIRRKNKYTLDPNAGIACFDDPPVEHPSFGGHTARRPCHANVFASQTQATEVSNGWTESNAGIETHPSEKVGASLPFDADETSHAQRSFLSRALRRKPRVENLSEEAKRSSGQDNKYPRDTGDVSPSKAKYEAITHWLDGLHSPGWSGPFEVKVTEPNATTCLAGKHSLSIVDDWPSDLDCGTRTCTHLMFAATAAIHGASANRDVNDALSRMETLGTQFQRLVRAQEGFGATLQALYPLDKDTSAGRAPMRDAAVPDWVAKCDAALTALSELARAPYLNYHFTFPGGEGPADHDVMNEQNYTAIKHRTSSSAAAYKPHESEDFSKRDTAYTSTSVQRTRLSTPPDDSSMYPAPLRISRVVSSATGPVYRAEHNNAAQEHTGAKPTPRRADSPFPFKPSKRPQIHTGTHEATKKWGPTEKRGQYEGRFAFVPGRGVAFRSNVGGTAIRRKPVPGQSCEHYERARTPKHGTLLLKRIGSDGMPLFLMD